MTEKRAAAPVGAFAEIADELYGLPPEEFTGARTKHEKLVRQAGDRELAARIHALAKPSVAAWLANQLAREHRDELQPLLELGAGLREATERLAGDQLRQLSREQHELVYALVQQGREVARAAGRSVSEDTARGLEDTLHAALADERAAAQLLAGRLTGALHRTGLGGDAADDEATLQPARTQQPRDDEQRRRAKRDVAEAERTLTDAERARVDAQAQLTTADEAVEEAERNVEQLRRQLDEASAAASEANRRRREQTTALRRAEHAVSDAERRHADAQARRERLN